MMIWLSHTPEGANNFEELASKHICIILLGKSNDNYVRMIHQACMVTENTGGITDKIAIIKQRTVIYMRVKRT